MNVLEFTRSTHVRNKIVVGNYQVVQLVVNFGTSTMLYVPVVARVTVQGIIPQTGPSSAV